MWRLSVSILNYIQFQSVSLREREPADLLHGADSVTMGDRGGMTVREGRSGTASRARCIPFCNQIQTHTRTLTNSYEFRNNS